MNRQKRGPAAARRKNSRRGGESDARRKEDRAPGGRTGRGHASKGGSRHEGRPAARRREDRPPAAPAPVNDHTKLSFPKAGNMLYPIPAVLVSLRDPDTGFPNLFTVAWTGTVCTDPPMVSIAVRKERFSYGILQRSKAFVINLVNEPLLRACDFCGVWSGRDLDKFTACGLTEGDAVTVAAPIVQESPVNIECQVRQVLPLGSHDLFLAEVTHVQVDRAFMDEGGRFHLEDAGLTCYVHGKYFGLGQALGSFGYSVRKRRPGK